MPTEITLADSQQTRVIDDFFYFFLRLRKSRVRKIVQMMQDALSGGDA